MPRVRCWIRASGSCSGRREHGGDYLLGMQQPLAEFCFADIAWSTSSVATATVDGVLSLGLKPWLRCRPGTMSMTRHRFACLLAEHSKRQRGRTAIRCTRHDGMARA